MLINNKILVTGANGFVGTALCRSLSLRGAVVKRVVRESSLLSKDIDTFIARNVGQETVWTDVLTDCNAVIHLAARAHQISDSSNDPLHAFRSVNTAGTLSLARQAAEVGVKRFVFVSTIGVNGAQTHGVPFKPEDKPAPHSDYAISKYEAEQGLLELSATGMEIVIVRPPLVYGKNAPGNFGALVKWVKLGIPLPLGRVNNCRSLVALDNLVDLLVVCVKHPSASNQIFLVSDGEDLSTSELLRKIGDAVGKPARLIPISQSVLQKCATFLGKENLAQSLLGDLQIDMSKTCEQLSWKPPVTPITRLGL